ncbi:serine carboxypeptidase S28-domain-containing protein [Ochromonadaceae sp. CCMP2298]|nr:serine carboxypeptidase S28-domain-containing protein [Ochromonadaceae sp. CCMP2298]
MLGLLLLQLVLTSAQTPSSADCTWKFVEQPLSHFARGIAGTYKQRLCVYEGYWTPDAGLPVFLYTGNESPVEEYVNNTGLLWDLAKEMNALVVFAEHRYFGESVPLLQGVDNCIAFLSSEEALADYAALVGRIRLGWGAKDSAVVAFGGSYGGMLAAWLRIAYPSAVDGGECCPAVLLSYIFPPHILISCGRANFYPVSKTTTS